MTSSCVKDAELDPEQVAPAPPRRMFHEVSATWNPTPGCEHGCTYCWARDLVLGKLKHLPRYQDGFTPKIVPQELKRRFRSGLIFVNAMGDGWGHWVPRSWILDVLRVVAESPQATFLFLTKNPIRYWEFLDQLPPNIILGATIESNRRYMLISRAPGPWERESGMAHLAWPKMVAIEPIIDFDLDELVAAIRRIKPEFVYIGYDNHHKRLPEPTLEQTRELIAALSKFTEVRTKTLREAWNHGGLDDS